MLTPETTAPVPMVKRTLVTLSHAVERAALAPGGDGPVVVVALFQRLPYFDRERDVYAELGARADAVVVGFVDDVRPQLPGRLHPVLLDPAEELAREWTVVVATPRTGAFLVAVDQETVAAGERTLEAGRLFGARWGFGAAGAHAELRRLRPHLASRVPPPVLATLDEVAAGTGRHGPAPAEDRAEASLRLLVAQLEPARRQAVALRERLDAATHGGDRDRSSRLHTAAFAERWVGSDRTTTAGPLPLALLLVTVPPLAGVGRYGARAGREVVTQVAAALTRRLRPVDRAVRLGEAEFLLVVPGLDERAAGELARDVTADLARLGDAYPFLPLDPVSAVTVTRQRPLPLAELRDTVRWAAAERVPIALLPA